MLTIPRLPFAGVSRSLGAPRQDTKAAQVCNRHVLTTR